MLQETLRKYSFLKAHFATLGKVAVAFSGGVDSTLALAAAREAAGCAVLALHARMPWQSTSEDEHLRFVADFLGCRLLSLEIDPLGWPEFVANPTDRCYHCKKKIFTLFLEQAAGLGISVLVDGTNADDLHQVRPGLAALQELGVRKPLAESRLTKKEIRRISEEQGLPTWNRPPGSCLATRISCGEKITLEKLALVRAAEDMLQGHGYLGCRVRLRADFLVVELQAVDIERFSGSDVKRQLLDWAGSEKGFRVYLDLKGRPELGRDGRFA